MILKINNLKGEHSPTKADALLNLNIQIKVFTIMTQATLVKPVEKFKTCLDCPHFQNFNEPEYLEIGSQSIPNRHRKGFGWCQLFNVQVLPGDE